MITNTIDDPHQLKTNNEVAKASLKKRLNPNIVPGPGNYNPQKVPDIGSIPSNNSTSVENAAMLRKAHDKNLFSKLGITDNDMIGKKGAAFNSTAPRFQSESTRNVHKRAATLNGDESQMNVYHLQMLEGPQIKARNQLLNNGELPDVRTISGKNNTMGLGVFRSTKIALAFGTSPEPSYLQRSQQANNTNRNNLK